MKEYIYGVYYIFCIICIAYAIYANINYFFWDKESEDTINEFMITKGKLYIVLCIVSLVFTFIVEDIYNIIIMVTVYIAIFEGIQSILSAKANKYKSDVGEKLKNHKRGMLKEIELLDQYCRIKLAELEQNSTSENAHLIYEEVYEYLKYYFEAKEFLNALHECKNGKIDMKKLYSLEDAFIEEFKWSCIRTVKMPE